MARLWGFFLISHGWTWFFWGIPLLSGENVWSYPNVVFIYLGGIGPPLAGIVMTALTKGRWGLGELWQRLFDIRRIEPGWYVAIFLLVPVIAIIAILIDLLLGPSAQPVNLVPLLERLQHPFNLLMFILFIFLLGPLPEEIGWRGYVLDQLQERWSALTASLVLGTAWGAWHIPLFFMNNYYENFGGSPPDPFWFFYNIILNTILLTWIYNNNHRSVLAAVLFHFMLNFTGEILPLSTQADQYKSLLMTIWVVFVVLWWGPGSLRHRPASSGPDLH